jgi:hypothetical protein
MTNGSVSDFGHLVIGNYLEFGIWIFGFSRQGGIWFPLCRVRTYQIPGRLIAAPFYSLSSFNFINFSAACRKVSIFFGKQNLIFVEPRDGWL